jgi:hypothetical protein
MGRAASPIADRRQQSKRLSRHSRRYAAISAPAAHFGAKPPVRRVGPNPFSHGSCTPEGVSAPLNLETGDGQRQIDLPTDLNRYSRIRGQALDADGCRPARCRKSL